MRSSLALMTVSLCLSRGGIVRYDDGLFYHRGSYLAHSALVRQTQSPGYYPSQQPAPGLYPSPHLNPYQVPQSYPPHHPTQEYSQDYRSPEYSPEYSSPEYKSQYKPPAITFLDPLVTHSPPA